MGSQRDASSRAPLGKINVILAVRGRTSSRPSWVLSIARPHLEDSTPQLKKAKIEVRPALSFSDEDKVDTIQPHNDALGHPQDRGYDVKRCWWIRAAGLKSCTLICIKD